jgi:hypothetical protein
MPFTFKIEHIALQPPSIERAQRLLKKLGLDQWISDEMEVYGEVWGKDNQQAAVAIDFNYQSDCDRLSDTGVRRPIELEVMATMSGPNWMDGTFEPFISHFGMQVTHEQLKEVHDIMSSEGIKVAQNVVTLSHKNSHVQESRRYKKVIFDTRGVLGVDLEFNVLLPLGA